MSLDTNTWYSIQSFGTDYNLAINNSSSSGSVFSQSEAGADNALWQVNPVGGNSPTFLRTKQTGANYCLSSANGQLSVAQCSGSEVWTVALFNGQNPSDGYYLAPGNSASTPRLNEAESGNTVSLQEYSGSSANDVYFQWAFRSVSAINDAAYSTVPPGGSQVSSSTTTSSSSSSNSSSSSTTSPTSSSLSSSSSSSSSRTTTSSTSVETITHIVTPSTTPAPETRTNTVVVTGSSTAGSGSSSPSVSPSAVPPNSATTNSLSTRQVFVVGLLSLTIGFNLI